MDSLNLLLSHPETKMAIHDLVVLIILVTFVVVFFYIKKNHHQSVSTKSIFIAIFLFLIILPLLQQHFNIFQYKPLDEKRYRLTMPPGNMLTGLFQENSQYAHDYEKYYNDNYGLRDNFIRLKNQIDYTFFKVSDEVLVGKNNFLFYKNVVEKEKIYIEQIEEQAFLTSQNSLLKINSQLKSKDILFVVLPIPMKDSLYSELYIKRSTQIPSATRFDRLLSFLQSHPEIKTIPAKEVLLETKKNYPVFYKTDFHWNDIGAHFLSQETINLLATWTNTKINWDYPPNIKPRSFSGGQNDSLALLIPKKEQAFFVEPNRHHQSTVLEPEPPFIYHFISKQENKSKLLPKTVFIGNSYLLAFLNTGFFDFFSEVLVIHNNNIEKLPPLLPKDTKIIILQIIEIDLLKDYIFKTNFTLSSNAPI